jgi:hypothetical protein
MAENTTIGDVKNAIGQMVREGRGTKEDAKNVIRLSMQVEKLKDVPEDRLYILEQNFKYVNTEVDNGYYPRRKSTCCI